MIYFIGLGLNEKGITLEGLEAIKKSDKIYLENYTVDFPYTIEKLEQVLQIKITPLERNDIENDRLIIEAKNKNISLLIYGSPLFATTHLSLIDYAIKNKVVYKVIHSYSIFDAVAETGLELYKFGKVCSLPKWIKNYEPDSFLDYLIDNMKINAHTLLLSDIGLPLDKAIEEIEISIKKRKIKLDKILLCSNVGNTSNFYYGKLDGLNKLNIKPPFCFIIPGKLHFIEENFLKRYLI
jgi:diphthine synthase